MSFQKNKLTILFLFLSLLSDCRTGNKFVKLQKNHPDHANLYLMRSFDPVLSLYSYPIEIYKLKGHFKEDKLGSLVHKTKLITGEYCFFSLERGFYRLAIENEFEKIIFLENEKTQFIDFKIIKKGFFEFPEYYLKELSTEEGLEKLLEDKHLTSCDQSMD